MVKESTCQCRRLKRCGLDPWVRKIPWRRKWQPAPVLLPGEAHGQRGLVGYSHGVTESRTHLTIHTLHTSVLLSKTELIKTDKTATPSKKKMQKRKPTMPDLNALWEGPVVCKAQRVGH